MIIRVLLTAHSPADEYTYGTQAYTSDGVCQKNS